MLMVEDFEDLQFDLNIVHIDFLNLQRKPAVLRGSGYKQYAEELSVLKRRVEEVARRFGQKLNQHQQKYDQNRTISAQGIFLEGAGQFDGFRE